MSVSVTPVQDLDELQRSFEAFNRISQSLERAYERLRRRASDIDTALAESNRRLAEKVRELDETSGHLQAVLHSLHSGVVVTDLDGRITLVNRAFAELAGTTIDSLSGRPKSELQDRRGAPLCPESHEEDGALREIELQPGRTLSVRSRRTPVHSATGEVLGELETLVDETLTEELRQELRKRETLSALGEMAAGIAHELRNPMSAIEGFASLLQRALPEGHRTCEAHAERIVRGIRRANSIITNLLCYARPERFRPRRVGMQALVRSLRETLEEQRRAGPLLSLRPPQPEDLEVNGDAALLERLVVNLVENARSAVGPEGSVQVLVQGDPGEVRLHVLDDGPGIPAEIRERLFLPFVTGRADGTGLGLAIVHRIVDLHRGRIEVHPRAPRGTEFVVHLPRDPQQALQRGVLQR